MRHLVECGRCQIQYDATGYATGSRFHCHSGHLVEVKAPAGPVDLQVVSCSNCGGNREGNTPNCQYCGADFSLMDRDLGVICGHCTSRTGNHAKFCHRCGTAIDPHEAVGKKTDVSCLRCEGRTLHSRVLHAGIVIHECEMCTGIWLSKKTFAQIEQKQIDMERLVTPTIDLEMPGESIQSTDLRPYIKCPECSVLMNRMNYRKVSGILIDICRDHGVWFDGGELAAMIDFLQKGGVAKEEAAKHRMDVRTIMNSKHRKTDIIPLDGRSFDRDWTASAERRSLTYSVLVTGKMLWDIFD